MSITQLGAYEIAQTFAQGSASAVEIVQAHLEVVRQKNDDLQAFVAFEPDLPLERAGYIDANRDAFVGKPLAAVPFAVKDVLESARYPTAYGSEIYAGHRPSVEAACSLAAQRHGAIMMGKVATGEFATQTPSKARNPLRPTHTPGGSSSGSAAAVGSDMVPVAFGTQTTGSIVRPAVFCGVVGYKPTFGLIGTSGLKTLSHTQDTIGVVAKSVLDASFFTFGLLGARHVERVTTAPRLAVCMSRQWDYLDAQTEQGIEDLVTSLREAGAQVDRVWLPDELEFLVTQQPRLFLFEANQNLAHEFDHHRAQLSQRLQDRLASAQQVTLDEYLGLRQQVLAGQHRLSQMLSGYDGLLYPAAAGEAPAGLKEGGDPRFGALWSLLGAPSVSFPIGKGRGGLPIGAQVVGDFGNDVRALRAAMFVSRVADYTG